MKSFIAFAALVAVAVASPLQKPIANEAAELEAIIAAIQSPNTDPATAALLEQQLQQIFDFQPIHVGPAIIAPNPEPIHVGPALVESNPEPIQVGPVIVAPEAPVDVSPVVVAPVSPAAPAPSSSPLVQIIVNVNQASDIGVSPVGNPVEVLPTPVNVVDNAQEEIIPSPVQVVEEAEVPIVPTPVVVVEEVDAPAEAVIIGTPVAPIPVVNIPGTLN